MEIRVKARTFLVAVLATLAVSGCGKKADLFLPEENAAVSSSQQTQTDKQQKKKQPITEN